MITNWNEFEEWRRISLAYHSNYGTDRGTYNNALTFFEYARKYFNTNGFPIQKDKYKNGKPKPWSSKQKKQQREDISNFIKTKM